MLHPNPTLPQLQETIEDEEENRLRDEFAEIWQRMQQDLKITSLRIGDITAPKLRDMLFNHMIDERLPDRVQQRIDQLLFNLDAVLKPVTPRVLAGDTAAED